MDVDLLLGLVGADVAEGERGGLEHAVAGRVAADRAGGHPRHPPLDLRACRRRPSRRRRSACCSMNATSSSRVWNLSRVSGRRTWELLVKGIGIVVAGVTGPSDGSQRIGRPPSATPSTARQHVARSASTPPARRRTSQSPQVGVADQPLLDGDRQRLAGSPGSAPPSIRAGPTPSTRSPPAGRRGGGRCACRGTNPIDQPRRTPCSYSRNTSSANGTPLANCVSATIRPRLHVEPLAGADRRQCDALVRPQHDRVAAGTRRRCAGRSGRRRRRPGPGSMVVMTARTVMLGRVDASGSGRRWRGSSGSARWRSWGHGERLVGERAQ